MYIKKKRVFNSLFYFILYICKMNRIYLRLKKDMSILVSDGNWSLHTGDMLVFQKIGTKSEIKRNEYSANEYIHTDSYLLVGFEYKTIKDIKAAFEGNTEYHMVWKECNSVDTLIKLSTGAPLYHSKELTYSEILKYKDKQTPLLKDTYEYYFDDVSLPYNRDNKLKEILQ